MAKLGRGFLSEALVRAIRRRELHRTKRGVDRPEGKLEPHMLRVMKGGFKDLAAKRMLQADLQSACVGTRCALVAGDPHLLGNSGGERASQAGVDWAGGLDVPVVSSFPNGTRVLRRVKFRHESRSVHGPALGSFDQALWR